MKEKKNYSLKQENRYLKNTIILFIGKFSTQMSSVLLLPLFTHFLSTADYGFIDLIQTYINLFVPVLLLCFDSAIFRFLIDKRDDRLEINYIISNAFIFLIFQNLLIILIAIILYSIIKINYFGLTILNILTLMLSNLLLQVCRGLGKNKDYSISTILIAISNLLINLILIIKFKLGAQSILWASIIGNLISSLYILFGCKIYKNINTKYKNKRIIKEMLKYSLPMIPNTLSWWIINVSDHTIISLFISTAANAIYTVSCKFSNIINSIFSIFIMSWQETASIHINDNDKDDFFSKNIEETLIFFTTLIAMIIAILPLAFNIIIGSDYEEAYIYIPILLITSVFSIFTSLIGGVYVAKKLTKEVAKTSILSSVLNLTINLILINVCGIYAACISTFISYFIMTVYRLIDVNRFIKLRFNNTKIILLCIFICFLIMIYYIKNLILTIMSIIIALIVFLILNKKLISDFMIILKNRVNHIKNK